MRVIVLVRKTVSLVIEVKNLTKIFHPARGFNLLIRNHHPVVALDRIHLQIWQGEVIALMGPNGAGKTTLLKILATLLLSDVGSASVFGWDCTRDEKEIKKRTGFLSGEEKGFYLRLTGRQNLDFFGGLFLPGKKERQKKIAALAERLNLYFLDRRVSEYSSGMRQRLALARVLFHDPPLLLLDEPTKGLDPETAENFHTFLAETLSKKEGKTILMVTHAWEEAKRLSERILFLNQGRLQTV